MSLRQEFLFLANQPGSKFSQLCQRFGISRKTGYKWLQRYQQTGAAGLADRSRRPQHSPRRTEAAVEQQVLAIRDQYGWGARKIKWCLEREGQAALARYSLCLQACRNEQTETVQQQLTATFRRYGLPERMLMDNGSPWGNDLAHQYTPLTVWL